MDVEALSDCSSPSLHSEETESQVSTLSGLSAYQDEFAELRHLINPSKYPSYEFERCSTPKQNGEYKPGYEESIVISNFSNNFQNSIQIQERYKSELYNLEKNLELKYYDKIEKLLKANHKLQFELDGANEQIMRLLKSYSCSSTSSQDKHFIHIENQYHNLNLKHSKLQQDYFESKSQKEEYEIENKQLRMELDQLKLDIASKLECINEFKRKTSSQFVEIETVSQNNEKISQCLKEVTSELAHVKKVQDWYKERLQTCQYEKELLSGEILKCKMEMHCQHERTEMLNVELSKWKAKCDTVELRALKDKEALFKQLDSMNVASDLKCDKSKFNIVQISENDTSQINYYKTSIQDLTQEIIKVKDYVKEQDILIERITKENSELIAHCITLQNSIRHSQISLEEFEDTKKELTIKLELMNDKVKQKSDELVVRENQLLVLQTELKAQKEEQELVEETVKTIREQFTVFKSKYGLLEDELLVKNKYILQVENERQKLFMDNNWQICELEKLKEKDTAISQLKDQLTKCHVCIDEKLETIKKLENEITKVKEENVVLDNEKETITEKNHTEINKYENVLTQYKITVSNYEKQVNDLQKLVHESDIKIADLKDNVKILKQEIHERDISLNETNNRCTILEKKFTSCDNQCGTEILYGNKTTDLIKENNVNSKLLEGVMLEQSENDSKMQICNYIHMEKSSETTSFKNRLSFKITELEKRIRNLSERSWKNNNTLTNILNFVNEGKEEEKMQNLNVLLQVKDRELKERQKKYETNYRTLLRKVKEHMKGRNVAEKQNKYLQEMYNSLSNENNSLKLEVASKECEVENIKNILDKFTNVNEKLKLSISKLEQRRRQSKSCDNCKLSDERVDGLEKCIKELENEKLACQNALADKENIVITVRKEIQQLLQNNVALCGDNKKLTDQIKTVLREKDHLCVTIGTLEEQIKKQQFYIDELNEAVKQGNKQFSVTNLEKNRLRNSLEETNTKVEYMSKELKILSSRLQIKSEEITRLGAEKMKLESHWIDKEKDYQNVTNTLKRYLHDMHSEFTSVTNDKLFLKRLCNDLKLTLKSYVNHNKMLKQQLDNFSKEKEFNSLPNVLPNMPCDIKYDDNYINRLLQQNREPSQEKPITEIKSCLDVLKKEIWTLQEQISKKNIQY